MCRIFFAYTNNINTHRLCNLTNVHEILNAPPTLPLCLSPFVSPSLSPCLSLHVPCVSPFLPLFLSLPLCLSVSIFPSLSRTLCLSIFPASLCPSLTHSVSPPPPHPHPPFSLSLSNTKQNECDCMQAYSCGKPMTRQVNNQKWWR